MLKGIQHFISLRKIIFITSHRYIYICVCARVYTQKLNEILSDHVFRGLNYGEIIIFGLILFI